MKKNDDDYEPCHFLPYSQTRKSKPPSDVLWFDVSSHAEHPYCLFSPFFLHGDIPVPGMAGEFSDTVEGIWQGLKVIGGEIATRYFSGRGKKRRGKPSGHQYGSQKRLLDIVEARRKIYIPAYNWMLENKIPQDIIEEIISRAFQKIPQFFYDLEDNGAVEKDQPLAHSSILVSWFNQKCSERLQKE